MMKKFDLITIDVWDTLLRRKSHPDTIKLHVSNFLINNYYAYIKLEYRSSIELLKQRQTAEGKVGDQYRSSGMDDEYALHEIYRSWLQSVLISYEGIDELIAVLEKVEIQQEKYVVYADPHIEKFLSSYSAKSRVFVSDFYMSATHIMELLRHVGLEHLVGHGYSSCDHYLNKRSGRLFQMVHDLEKVQASSTLHIGDNLHSDVSMPKKLGAKALAFLPESEVISRLELQKVFESRASGIYKLFASDKNLGSTGNNVSGTERSLYDYGRNTAALLVGFMLFIMEQAIRQKHERVYFFTREGEFFRQIYDALREAEPLGQPAPPSAILEVSRLATFAPSLRALSIGELMRLWNLYGTQSMASLLKTLNVNVENQNEYLSRYGLNPQEQIQYPWLDSRVIALFNDSQFCTTINQQILENRNTLLMYLQDKGLNADQEKAAIVDIGWRGTIQDNLAYLFPKCQFDGYYLGLDKFLNNQPANCSKASFGPNLNFPDWEGYSDFFNTVAPVEMLCNSPNGSVTGYRAAGNQVEAERIVDTDENAVFHSYVRHYQSGVLSAVPEIANTIRIHAVTSEELRPLATQLWKSIIQQPNPSVATAYFQLNHNEQFGVGGFEDKRMRIGFGYWAKALFSVKGMREFVIKLETIGWPEGYLARSNLLFLWSSIKTLRKFRKNYLKKNRRHDR